MKFLNRERELTKLEQEWASSSSSFIPIYGRRRVGKSRLITHFLQDKEHVYYLAAQESSKEQVKELKELFARKLGDEFLLESNITDWKSLFTYLKNNLGDKKIIIALDEVTYLIRSDRSLPSYLQKFWDEFLKDSNIMLILSGSLVGLMKESILEHSSPLYGRRSGQIHLQPLGLGPLIQFSQRMEQAINLYSVCGGVPKYYEQIDFADKFQDTINKMLTPESFFFQEGTFLLTQEFKELGNYNSILKSISKGNTELAKISNDIGLESRKMSNYLDTLHELGFIKKVKPITSSKKRYRGYRYFLKDNFLDFWFRFIFPNRSHIESGNFSYDNIEQKLKQFVSKKFEELCRDSLRGHYEKVGTWWYKENEIDLVGLDEANTKILLGECKWSENKVGIETLKNSEKTAQLVDWNKNSRKVSYALFSKSGFKQDLMELDNERSDLDLYDLGALEKVFQS